MHRRLLILFALILLPATSFRPAAASERWVWPLDTHRIDRVFDPPESVYGRGHRGIDLPGRVGQTVSAAATGTVTFVGSVAGIPTITITHGGERSTYQPVSPSVRPGDAVIAGQTIGRLLGGHPSCRSTCLNLGRLRGEEYLDPADLLSGSTRFRLVDPHGSPPAPPVSSSGFAAPIAGPVTSAFGMRIHPVTGVRKLHDGADIAAPCGTPVPAVAGGTVTASGSRGAYGLQIEVRHSPGLSSSYAHLSSRAVRVGEHVAAGQVIGKVGTTGLSTGCHLHLMRIVDGRPVDPLS